MTHRPTSLCRTPTRAPALVLRHGRSILLMGFATIPVPPSRFPGHYSNSPWHLPRAQHAVWKRLHPLIAFVGFLQHHSTVPSKAALLTTCFTHQLFGVGGVRGAVGAAGEAG